MENREFKFRAWDKKNKRWFRTELEFYGFSIFGECTLICPPKLEDLEHLDITQYTGLKDKEGKEIYEGDIVRIDNSEHDEKGEYDAITVVKNIEGWIFELCNANGDGGTWTRQFNPGNRERLSVIGNIYENIDILEKYFGKNHILQP